LKEEEAMRLQVEQQLLHERQERLQKALLAGSLQVEQKDELLQILQKKIEEHKNGDSVLKQINQIIDQHKRVDDTQASYKADLDNIRPEFFEKLKEKSANSLSRLDLKHCSYISMGLTNKEIAQHLGVASKSILMARYRIKLKLGLGKEDDLDEFIGKLK
jgi:DNA-binding NarL/FixJ family response regulator